MAPLMLLLLLLPALMLIQQTAVAVQADCRFTIDEGVPVGATIDDSSLYGRCFVGKSWQTGDSVTLRRVGEPEGQTSNLLSVTEDGLSLKRAAIIDREDPRLGCRSQSPCKVRFSAMLQNRNQPDRMALVEFDLLIRDVNDNHPQFDTAGRVLTVKENSVIQRHQLPTVTDADAGKNGKTTTMILRSSHPERMLKDKLQRAETDQPTLLIGPDLDYETLQSYNLTLQACDQGLQSLCTTAVVEVRIQDENDHVPYFDRQNYSFQISESDWQPGGPEKMVGQVRASDKDSGDNSRIRYSLEDEHASFRVDPSSGILWLTGPVNAADHMPLEIRVKASDHGDPPLSEQVLVQVNVTDVNDHAPRINLINVRPSPEHPDRPIVWENAEPDVVAHATVTDEDKDDNGKFSCRLGTGAGSFVMSTTSRDGKLYKISSTRKYDREVDPSDLFVIICTDRGSPPMTSNLTVVVDIADQNEFSPSFNTTVIYSEVDEGLRAGANVAQVVAHDGDATANLTYSFSDESQTRGRFQINPHTGLVSTLRPLDREAPGEFPSGSTAYSFAVQASDGQRSATVQVEVRVRDVNDNAPIVKAPHVLEVNETYGSFQQNSIFIGQLEYEDLDDPETPNARAIFQLDRIVSPRSLNATYRVDSTGRIWASGRLDREAGDRHLLLISVQDFGRPSLSSSATVTISLLDLNDNPPVVLRPVPNEVINITSDHTPGVLVLQVEAQDADLCGLPQPLSGRDCVLTGGFRMQLQQSGGRDFQLDEATGSLRVLSSLSPGLHPLTVTVTDSGRPQAQSVSVKFAVFVERRSDGSLFAPVWGPSSNWTVLLVIVGASSFITVILVVAIVMLTRRQPCMVGGSANRRSYGGAKEQRRQQAVSGVSSGDPPEPVYGGQAAMDGATPLTTFGPGLGGGHLEVPRRENGAGMGGGFGGGTYSQHLGPHNSCLFPPGDCDVGSADSGHGASEEEMMHSEHRFSSVAPGDHHARYASLQFGAATSSAAASAGRSRSPLCSCILEEELHQQCQERLPLTYYTGAGRQPLTLIGDPQFDSAPLQSPGYGRSLARPPSAYSGKSAAV